LKEKGIGIRHWVIISEKEELRSEKYKGKKLLKVESSKLKVKE